MPADTTTVRVDLSLGDAVRTIRAGADAADAGKPVTECPHRGKTPKDRLLAAAWLRGYKARQEKRG